MILKSQKLNIKIEYSITIDEFLEMLNQLDGILIQENK